MKMAELKKMRERVPFRPFAIHLASGEVLPVGHSELLSVSPEVDDLFSLWVGKEWNLIDIAAVSRTHVITKANGKSKT
jgi:hypothetical protein